MIKNGEYCYRIALLGEINCGMSQLFSKLNPLVDTRNRYIGDYSIINLELIGGDKIEVGVWNYFHFHFYFSFFFFC